MDESVASSTKLKDLTDMLPLSVAILSLLSMLAFNGKIIPLFIEEQVSFNGLYGAIFDWSSIQTGFLFAVYGFVVGKRDGFMGAISKTRAMSKFSRTLKKAIIVGFLLTLSSMPLMVIPVEVESFGLLYFLLSLWVSLFVWAFLLFCKVAYTFGVIVRVPDNADKPAR